MKDYSRFGVSLLVVEHSEHSLSETPADGPSGTRFKATWTTKRSDVCRESARKKRIYEILTKLFGNCVSHGLTLRVKDCGLLALKLLVPRVTL